jgi:hypothetical protein
MLPKYAHISGQVACLWRTSLWFALFIAALGLLPHLLFSLNVGDWHYTSNAWDEDSYTGYALRHQDIIYRTLSANILRAFVAWFGLDGALMGFDVVFPFLTALLACAIAYHAGFRTYRSLFLAMCLLLFALNFMALSNAAMVGNLPTQLLPFSSMVYPDWIRQWVPSLYENFFSLYKTPEPQIGFVVQFAVLYLLLRYAQTMQQRHILGLALLSLSFPFIYVSTGIALLLLIGMVAVAGLIILRDRRFLGLLACGLIAAAYYLFQFTRGEPIQYADGFIFHSRLPIFSASMLWGGLLIWAYAKQSPIALISRAWCMQCTPRTLLALACCVLPFITLNQQIITGQMVQSRTWDYYTNFPFVALALLLLWSQFSEYYARFMPKFLRARAYYAAPLLAGVLIAAQWMNFYRYSDTNTDNLAVAQALHELADHYPDGLPNIMLENSGDDSQVALRLGDIDRLAIGGYQQTIKHFVSRLSAGDAAHAKSIEVLKEHGFAYFDRLGLSADALETRMRAAANKAMGGIEVIYFFSFLDNWKPLSDFREQRIAAMQEKIPAIIADYRAFQKNAKRRNQFGELLYITRRQREARDDVPWRETLVATRTLGAFMPVTVYIYRQSPR